MRSVNAHRIAAAAIGVAVFASAGAARAGDMPASGWLNWRGPNQNGTSGEVGLPEALEPIDKATDWSIDLPGRGTPAIAQYLDGARLYAWGYTGEGIGEHEVLVALDPATGEEQWRLRYPDFLSDVIYERYSIGAPTVDPQTGRVYLLTTPGLLVCVDRDGKELWRVSMLEEYGRLTFPNGRTGSPAIDGDLVIVNAITSNWGTQGPARNRFYAFEKETGKPVWASDPGVGPPFLKDSSFCTPVFANEGAMRVFYACLGDGNVVCVNALTGEPVWRYQLAIGGVNSSVVLTDKAVIAIHGKENVGDTGRGRMVAIKRDATPEPDKAGRPTLGENDVLWRNDDVAMFSSSPVLANGRVYQLTLTGELFAIDADTGRTIWQTKLGNSTLHASPLYADGKLYVPMWTDGLYIIRDAGDRADVLDHVQLEGDLIGSPAVFAGKLYQHTTQKLYCFRQADASPLEAIKDAGEAIAEASAKVGRSLTEVVPPVARVADLEAVRLRVIPSEFLLRPGEAVGMYATAVNALGQVIPIQTMDLPAAEPWIPPTARVKARLDAEWDAGQIVANQSAKYSAGSFRFQKGGGLTGFARGRILPSPPFSESFDGQDLTETDGGGARWAYPPLPWIGARFKWEVREDPTDAGNKVLAKTLDNVLFMRSMVFFGHPEDRDYVIRADVMSDGNRRQQSTAGVICQRYIICLDGNAQQLRVYSNIENFNRARDLGQVESRVDFPWRVGRWYTIKATVETTGKDGAGVIKAKAWPRGENEPADWTIEVPVPIVHQSGSPGLFGLSPQSNFKVYVDNIVVTPRG